MLTFPNRLLNKVLREHWNWTSNQQWVTSDCDAIQNIYLPHGYNETREQAAAQALIAGVDVNCGTYYQELLPRAYEQGLFKESLVDQALIRQYSSLVQLGYFDGAAVPYRNLTFADVSTPYAQDLALKAATESIVLLKNDGLLPVKISNGTKVALIGGWANATTQMQGNYAGIAPYLHSPYYAAQQLNATVYLSQVPGGQGDPTTNNWLAAFDAANKSDIIIYVDGIDNSVESEGMDRYNLDWTGAQLDMIGQLAGYGKPMIVVQMGGGQIDSSPIMSNTNISSLLWAGYPGQDGGVAIFDILTGKIAPAGRLPTTQYPSHYAAQIPATDMTLRPSNVTGSPGRTYQWYTGEPVFSFGYGMHYTNFSASIAEQQFWYNENATHNIADLIKDCHEHYQDKCLFQTYKVKINNVGGTTSDYVTLGYLSGAFGPAPYPSKKLVAYKRLHGVTAGGSATATLDLTLGSLARIDSNGNTVLYPGTYKFSIDNDHLATASFTLVGDAATLNYWPQRPDAPKQTTDYFIGDYGSTYDDVLYTDGKY